MKKIILLILILSCVFSITSCGENWVLIEEYVPGWSYKWADRDTDINNYEKILSEVKYADKLMPKLSELDGYTNISFSHQLTLECLGKLPFFTEDGIALFIEYPEDIYEQKKTETLFSYDFIDEPYVGDDGTLESAIPSFDYKGYHFQTAIFKGDNGNDTEYNASKHFVLVGYSNEMNRIVYCCMSAVDLDYIAEPGEDYLKAMIEFMDKHFYWNDIK